MGIHVLVSITSPRSRLGAAIVAAVLMTGLSGVAGCSQGGRGNPSGPVRAAEAFESAVERGDQAAACALLAPPTRKELEHSGKEECAKALQQEDLPDGGTSGDVEVFGDEAIARMKGDVLFLTSVAGTWMVSAAGCTQQPDQPYECEVKGS